ncbi:MAG: peptide-methionine (S)-S-oxide reductase MsrA [Candidatus Sungbacteria bacterium]|uniref:Peptide methionine sulfoxide reductase MsrA n=1 Tax=Candidatus Sungiibacteriota bacterium TaxID=2750080 RepID=A0A9D6LT09_9BACT|nr:peptide-methionine (S)-S-oxide reductase MsrA [Candidatus Sungbacteria bacterium]
MAKTIQRVAFGGGCFWCTEAVFLELKGVANVTPGYAGGALSADGKNPTYGQVSSGKTGHAEVILIEYDPSIISFQTLLDVFFISHDPTTLNRQGNDVGTQYRSVILFSTDDQKKEAEASIADLAGEKKYSRAIVTEVVPLGAFYPAEEYHREYYQRHPTEGYSQYVIEPKMQKLKKERPDLLKSNV